MSKPREKWWGYVKAMIRSYPDLQRRYDVLKEVPLSAPLTGMPGSHMVSSPTEQAALRQLNPTAQKELEAVSAAINVIKRKACGELWLRVIDLVYWRQTHTLEGAALQVNVSYPTAKIWNRDFVYLVAEKYGFHKSLSPRAKNKYYNAIMKQNKL